MSDQLALAERPIDDDGDAALARQRQDAVFDLAIEDVVGDLDEIERLLRMISRSISRWRRPSEVVIPT